MKELKFIASDGKKLTCVLWDRVTRPVGVVQIIHGMDEHVRRYDRFAKFLNRRGYIVFGDDHRAHGKSATSIAAIGTPDGDDDLFGATVMDELEILKYLRGRFNLPVFLFGHSYGSFITQSVISQTSAHSGVCLSGSALYPRVALGIANMAAWLGEKIKSPDAPARFLEYFSPIRSKPGGPSRLTRDRAQAAAHARDPYRSRNFSYGFYHSLFHNLMTLRRRANPDIPMLIISGSRDLVSMNARWARGLYNFYRRHGVEHISLRIYPDARHELLMELNYADVQRDIVQFLDNARRNAGCINRCEIHVQA
ncbi:MAG: alpha/beta hydrolase [Alphaproteobacteria bacterium]|nr:alpha/beta hydrolase [Alphaproteobacteria bacterium]